MTHGPNAPGRDADADLPPAAAERWASRWEARLAAVAEALERPLERPLAGPGRAALQAELDAVHREADAMSAAAARLRDRAAELARRWQATASAASAGAPVRVDHLGASTFLEKGWSRLALGDAPAAEEAFRHALTLAPGSAEGEVLLAWALGHGGRTTEARQVLAGVLSRVPQHALALATLGYVALRDGDLDGAEALLRRAVAAGGDRKASLYAWFHLGVVARRRGALDAAEAAFGEALRQGPNLLQAWYERGRARWEAGQGRDAVAAWRAGAAAGKFNPWGRQCSELVDRVEAGEAPVFVDA
ncbi:MAG: tetratricopeptide repeat protein [Gemmatimonadetes bacterium]|nr:tetratricopeptide repeat protein [Gemmatimonadota bacterium]